MVAIAAVKRAAKLCQKVIGTITKDVIEKKDKSPVTLADYGSQALVCELLANRFPNDLIVAEENAASLRTGENLSLAKRLVEYVGATDGPNDLETICSLIDRGGAEGGVRRFWTLDPLDGTKGFLRGEQYAVALALIIDGEVKIAVLACPNYSVDNTAGKNGTAFVAVESCGAFVLSLGEDLSMQPINVTQETSYARLRFCESVEAGHSSHDDTSAIARLLGIIAPPVRLDSQTKYAVVGHGGAEAYLRLPKSADYDEKIWDHAAGALIVTEAGGKVTDIHGQPLNFACGRSLSENRGVVATNGSLHEGIIAAIRELGLK